MNTAITNMNPPTMIRIQPTIGSGRNHPTIASTQAEPARHRGLDGAARPERGARVGRHLLLRQDDPVRSGIEQDEVVFHAEAEDVVHGICRRITRQADGNETRRRLVVAA